MAETLPSSFDLEHKRMLQQYMAMRSAVGLLDHEPACGDTSHLLGILSRTI